MVEGFEKTLSHGFAVPAPFAKGAFGGAHHCLSLIGEQIYYKVFCDLAKVFGVYDKFSENKSEMQWLEEFYNQALTQSKGLLLELPDFAKFWEANEPLQFEIPAESEAFVRYADFREDPILNPLGTDSGLIEIYSQDRKSVV